MWTTKISILFQNGSLPGISMESSDKNKSNESDECDINGDKKQDDMTVQLNDNLQTKDADERDPPKDLENLESSDMEKNETETAKLKRAPRSEDEEVEDDTEKSKGSDEEERKEKRSNSKKTEEESSSNTTSTSTSDDESESSSEDRTEPSKLEQSTTTAQAEVKSEESKESVIKNEDTTTDDSDIEDDLVSAINYNTITSLAALKDMLQSSGEDSDGVDSFFHHYFLSHVNRLPSRNQTHSPYPWGRRLSECREEDEYETEEGEENFLYYLERVLVYSITDRSRILQLIIHYSKAIILRYNKLLRETRCNES